MKQLLLASIAMLILSAVVLYSNERQPSDTPFTQFKTDFGKHYPTQAE